MALIITVSPVDNKLFNSSAAIEPIARAFGEECQKRGFFRSHVQGLRLTIQDDKFLITFPTLWPEDGESVNFIVRELGVLLDELSFGELFYVTNASVQKNNGDVVFSHKDLKPEITKNTKLMESYGIEDDKIPPKFICQLSQQLMDNPVYLKDKPDIHFDREHFQYWLFQQAKPHNPYTTLPILISDIVPNHELKKEIQAFVSESIVEKLKEKKQLEDLKKRHSLTDTSPVELAKGLRRAAAKGNVDDVKFLIPRVADINQKDDNPAAAKTALHHAVIQGHLDCVRALLAANAKQDITDAQGKTALEYAKEGSNEVRRLFGVEEMAAPASKAGLFRNSH